MSFNLMRYNVEKFISKTKYKIKKYFADEEKSTTEKTIRYKTQPPKPHYHFKTRRVSNQSWRRSVFGNLTMPFPFKIGKRLFRFNRPFVPREQVVNHNFICPECNGNRFRTVAKLWKWACRTCGHIMVAQTVESFVLPKTGVFIEE